MQAPANGHAQILADRSTQAPSNNPAQMPTNAAEIQDEHQDSAVEGVRRKKKRPPHRTKPKYQKDFEELEEKFSELQEQYGQLQKDFEESENTLKAFQGEPRASKNEPRTILDDEAPRKAKVKRHEPPPDLVAHMGSSGPNVANATQQAAHPTPKRENLEEELQLSVKVTAVDAPSIMPDQLKREILEDTTLLHGLDEKKKKKTRHAKRSTKPKPKEGKLTDEKPEDEGMGLKDEQADMEHLFGHVSSQEAQNAKKDMMRKSNEKTHGFKVNKRKLEDTGHESGLGSMTHLG